MGFNVSHPSRETEAHAETRHQLIEAAGEVFSEAGFRAATVLEIYRRARAIPIP